MDNKILDKLTEVLKRIKKFLAYIKNAFVKSEKKIIIAAKILDTMGLVFCVFGYIYVCNSVPSAVIPITYMGFLFATSCVIFKYALTNQRIFSYNAFMATVNLIACIMTYTIGLLGFFLFIDLCIPDLSHICIGVFAALSTLLLILLKVVQIIKK